MRPIVLITGASRGIGAATACLAAQQGYDVAINYSRQRDAAENVAGKARELGAKAILVQADVSDEAQVVDMFGQVDKELGRLDALVNNAGILFHQARVEDMHAERLTRILTVNVTGAFMCAREAVRRMSTRHGGHGGTIVNVSSAAARLGSPNEYVDYAASKGAIDTFTLGLAREVGEEGIRVNAVRPGIIDTAIHASGGEPERVARVAPSVPIKRGGEPEEVASTIVWLMGEQASYVTGALVDVTGGR